ncbi:Hypothetical protein Minf_2243 [Methylacidiphilum infernorum V4]|uniref:Uncharacterized protein n=1 Tax=Methylacidiphilum infernorum (isolate V4) TaxID=481448 RepID=B3DZW2_METI4|nr:Hypothetical protein Minf_2243 [Methylacidiphilum infernorum V4]
MEPHPERPGFLQVLKEQVGIEESESGEGFSLFRLSKVDMRQIFFEWSFYAVINIFYA